MIKPIFSIIIPTYNSSKTVNKTIRMPTKNTVNIKYFELTKSLHNKKSTINDKSADIFGSIPLTEYLCISKYWSLI